MVSRTFAPRAAGFTLIEVMIVVIIVGILLAIALPSYQESLRKGRRAEAKAALLDVSNRQEAYMLDRSTYTDNMRDLGFDPDPFTTEEGLYSIDASGACDPNGPIDISRCYTVTATPVSGGVQDDDENCHVFTLSSRGDKTAFKKDGDAADDTCW